MPPSAPARRGRQPWVGRLAGSAWAIAGVVTPVSMRIERAPTLRAPAMSLNRLSPITTASSTLAPPTSAAALNSPGVRLTDDDVGLAARCHCHGGHDRAGAGE